MLRRSRIGGAAFCLNCRGKKSNWGKLRGKTHCGEVQSQLFPCGIRDNRKKKDQKLNISSLFLWQREKDSNPHIRSQSPLCYHYTIPLCSLDEHLLLYQRFCICQELIVIFPDFFHLDDAGRFLANVPAAKVCGWRGRESGLREERRETEARIGCFGGRKIGKFYGFGENADSLLHFKLLYCVHQGFREEHRP